MTQFEFTPCGTPQMNGVVERAFPCIAGQGKALMYDARLKDTFRNMLWPHAYHTSVVLDNLLPRDDDGKDAYLYFGDKPPVKAADLVVWGRLGIVADKRIKKKSSKKGHKCVFLGYADDHSSDCYRFYNPETQGIIASRDVRWLD